MAEMKNRERTRELLIMHYQTYPKLQIQDLFKFLHQSAFGCEHLVSSKEEAKDFIEKEYAGIHSAFAPAIEALDGSYSRIPLSFMAQGLSADTFAEFFVASAKREENGFTALMQKLDVARELIRDGLLPFPQDDFEAALSAWAEKDYSAVRHSEVFREAYQPAYRVIANECIPALLREISAD